MTEPTKYSGCVTNGHPYVQDDRNQKAAAEMADDCIQKVTLFDVQWSNCPIEVEAEVRRMWQESDNLYNDVCFYKWDSEENECDEENWPIIGEYLKSRGVTKCLIHWWW